MQENILKKIKKLFLYKLLFFSFFITSANSSEKWYLDKNLSEISFEVPIFLASNVRGVFRNIEGLVEIDLYKKINNKAIFSVEINSVNINYNKYLDLLLSPIFFNSTKYPLSTLDTKNFSYTENSKKQIEVELWIKGKSQKIPLEFTINKLTNDLVKVTGHLIFLRSDFNIGTGKWQNTTFLKDEVKVSYNIFLFKE